MGSDVEAPGLDRPPFAISTRPRFPLYACRQNTLFLFGISPCIPAALFIRAVLSRRSPSPERQPTVDKQSWRPIRKSRLRKAPRRRITTNSPRTTPPRNRRNQSTKLRPKSASYGTLSGTPNNRQTSWRGQTIHEIVIPRMSQLPGF